ncbi:MAG: hypothetical protein AABX83_02695 [Nanoarchaeota archaeon]
MLNKLTLKIGTEYVASSLSPASTNFGEDLIQAKYQGHINLGNKLNYVFSYEKNGKTNYLVARDFVVRDNIISPINDSPFRTFDAEDFKNNPLSTFDPLRREYVTLINLVKGVINGN